MIPILYIHKGKSFYLKASLNQTKKYNPESRIILIGDNQNKNVWKEHYYIDDYNNKALAFEKVFVNYSPNPASFELFCFQRWFIILEFCLQNKLDKVLVCDSDTLLYCKVDEEFKKLLNGFDFTICATGTPCFVYITVSSLQKLCDFIMYKYAFEQGQASIKQYVCYLKDNNKSYGISDMTVFMAIENAGVLRANHIDMKSKDTKDVYDHNFTDVKDEFEMHCFHKRIYWKDKKPQFKSLKDNQLYFINGIHLQGLRAKLYIWHFLGLRTFVNDISLDAYLYSWLKYQIRKILVKLNFK